MVPRARNGPNGTAVRRPARSVAIIATPTTAPAMKPKNRPGQHDARVQPAEVHAEQWCQANVAVAHAALAERVDQPHRRQRDRCAERHHPDAFRFVDHDRCDSEGDAAQDDAGVGDLAGQALGLQIDPGLREQDRHQDAVRRNRGSRVVEADRHQHVRASRWPARARSVRRRSRPDTDDICRAAPTS